MADGLWLMTEPIRQIYDLLWQAYGSQHWWPARTPTEVVIGAILTQNTAWTNVQRAIENLRAASALSFARIRELPVERLATLIQPSGTYRVKANRLKTFVDFLFEHHGGDLESLLSGDVEAARRRLLGIHGIGPETADAILLYAGNRPTFVVDAYTRRILRRHRLLDGAESYEDVRHLFHDALALDVTCFNEYHALLVEVGKKHCRARARCTDCPLVELPHDGRL